MDRVPVVVVGGGVVGTAVAWSLARRGVGSVLVEARDRLAGSASGTNSGILHTGFDSTPGELETTLIRRSVELRGDLEVPTLRCGAVLEPWSDEDAATIATIARGAAENGVDVLLRGDGALEVPGESVTDPVAYTEALAAASGAEIRTGVRVTSLRRQDDGLVVNDELRADVVVNCAGLYADEVARLAGDDSFAVYPRKGEFFVFEGAPLDCILLPVPTKRTKGVLVFPTIDGHVIAGPTAHDQEDKEDWSVRPAAGDEVLAKARAMFPALEGLEPVHSYAGLRPAGRDGANYAIGASAACPGLVNVAAIRSTGLSASLGIGEYVTAIVGEQGVELGPLRDLPRGGAPMSRGPWWRR